MSSTVILETPSTLLAALTVTIVTRPGVLKKAADYS